MKTEQYKIELSEDAEVDFDSSYMYYEDKSIKIADDFFIQINNSFKVIAENPFGFQKIFKEIRRFVLNKFPFVIYYQTENNIVKIIAIFHTSRNPAIWKKRINKE